MKCLVNSYLVALLCKVTCTGKTGRAGAYYCNLVAVAFGTNGSLGGEGVVPVSNKSLKTTDTNALALDTSYALGLALYLLRTYAAANCGKR